MIFISLLIPFLSLAAFYALRKWHWKLCGVYLGATIIVSLLASGLSYFIGTRQDYYAEVWNYKVNAVRYYEDWDEEVPCRHPHYVTKTRTVTKTDSKGNSYTDTETYTEQDGWEHPYDVDYHPRHWEALTEYGNERSISCEAYGAWKQSWANEHFVDMHRSYHSKDGDMYESNWTRDFDRMFPMEHTQNYKNKVRVSNSVFNYPEVSKEVQKKYWRPADKGYTNGVLSYDGTAFTQAEDMVIRRCNAQLGPSSKIHVLVMLWNAETSSDIMNDVLAAWRGPNKNELVIAISVDGQRNVKWTQCYSWCDDTTIHSMVRQHVNDMGKLDFNKMKEVLLADVPKYWQKKDFREFEYIKNPLPWWCYLIAIVLSVGASVGGGIVICNKEDDLLRSLGERRSYSYV